MSKSREQIERRNKTIRRRLVTRGADMPQPDFNCLPSANSRDYGQFVIRTLAERNTRDGADRPGDFIVNGGCVYLLTRVGSRGALYGRRLYITRGPGREVRVYGRDTVVEGNWTGFPPAPRAGVQS